ncbi:type I restriction enzyme, S subunit [Xaviernesmea oryzae]|uniref:Type I restriction enzyme, S subunit n=1 Tax=Xaviernesmea oryzae TaxID=464029 RepID=A0A1X7EXW2_9HYPH|nr:restriction endonuclease subunit S [Xaviernesmea oryzae]SMF42163.1 type I restriction enzyme, S subunit [Xaviernesmea oryzae]
MTEWRASTWGEEISLEYGKALRGYGDADGEVPVYGTNGPVGWTEEPLTSGPGVILGRKGAYRGVHFSRQPFFVIDTAYYVVPKTELDMRWLYYAMIFHKLGEIDDGSPIPSTTRAAVYPRELEVPDIGEQKAIGAVLGSLDDKIELNQRMNETLEEMARVLFKSWFIDFDPVRAKMEGRDTGLAPDITALFPSRLVDSAIGEIPESWDIGPLDSALVLQRGFDLPAPKRAPGPYPVLAASGPSGTHNAFMVKGPGVTTGRSGVLGKVFYIDTDFWPLNTSLWVKEFRRSSPVYAFHLLQNIDLSGFNAGSAVPTLNRNHIHTLPTLLPPTELVETFEQTAAAAFARKKSAEKEIATLSSLRELLIPKLLSGEVSINNAEKLVGEAGA